MRDPLRDLVEPASPGGVRHRPASYRVGVVTGMDPLRVQVENEDTPVGSTPVSLVHTWTGAKVYLQSYAGMLVVVGNVVGSNILPSGVDLNNYIHPGVFYQPSNAAVGSNYPDGRAGILEVFDNSDGNFVLGGYYHVAQRFTTYLGAVWVRRHYNGWQPWVPLMGGPLCEVNLSESGTAATLQTVNMTISSQTGGFAISSDELLLPATGLWHATLFVDTGTRPTSSTTRHFVQLLLNGTVFNRQGLVMEDYGGTSSDFRATSGDALGVEWYPAVTTSLTGHLIARYIRP